MRLSKKMVKEECDRILPEYERAGLDPSLITGNIGSMERRLLRCVERKDPVGFGMEIQYRWDRLDWHSSLRRAFWVRSRGVQ